MSKTIASITLFLISLSSLTIGCAASDPATTNPDSAAQSASITYFSTVNSERDIAKFTNFLEDVENSKRMHYDHYHNREVI